MGLLIYVCVVISVPTNMWKMNGFTSHTAPPLTPQPHRTMSIIHDDIPAKPRAETTASFLTGEVEAEGQGVGGIQADGGGTWTRTAESVSPLDSPRIRSFTLIAPTRSKPE